MLLKLKGFQYATPLDLNMVYYHIILGKNSSNLCTIFLPWVIYLYKRLTMGVANFPENFQQEMNGLFHIFKFICTYIYDILVLTKGDWTDYVQKLESTLNKLKIKGLKL